MAVTEDQIAFAKKLFEDVGGISVRKMMGGLCLYSHSQIFALLGESGQIFIKAKDGFADEMAAAGSEIFSFTRKDGKPGSMGYWTLPASALDEPQEACEWAAKSLNANS
jgi:DNA transformation protein